jgi:hypothetical protein
MMWVLYGFSGFIMKCYPFFGHIERFSLTNYN